MNKVAKPRFNSAEAALRFYFRAREFLGGGADGAFQIPQIIPPGATSGEETYGDFAAVGSSLCYLDEFEIWLMRELYGPTCFCPRQRTVARALRAARERFPDRRLTRGQIGRLRHSTVAMLRRRLALQGLIPAAAGELRAAQSAPPTAQARAPAAPR
jgi:hypothetical protein